MNAKLQRKDIIYATYQHGTATVSDISRTLTITVPTAAKMVDMLTNERVLLSCGLRSSTGGRCAKQYKLNGEQFYFVVVCVERFAMRLAMANIANEIVTPVIVVNVGITSPNEMLKILQQSVHHLINDSGINRRLICGIGIAIPGLIDKNTGISHSYFDGAQMPIAQLFGRMFPYPVIVRHDMEVMTLAEYRLGGYKGVNNLLYFNIGAGFGMGIVLDGKMYFGNGGLVGEIGHIPLFNNDRKCYCGKFGCVETELSEVAVLDRVVTDIRSGVQTSLSQFLKQQPPSLMLKHVVQAANKGDRYAIGLVAQLAVPLAKAITVALHLLNPQVMVLGGELSEAKDYLLNPLLEGLRAYAMPQLLKGCRVVVSRFGEQAPLLGNVASMVEYFYGPTR